MEPAYNNEELIGKTIGKRRPSAVLQSTPLETASNRHWRHAGLGLRIKRGVYRFHSHEEADQWLMDHLTQTPAN